VNRLFIDYLSESKYHVILDALVVNLNNETSFPSLIIHLDRLISG